MRTRNSKVEEVYMVSFLEDVDFKDEEVNMVPFEEEGHLMKWGTGHV